MTVAHLLEIDAGGKCHQPYCQQHPHGAAVKLPFLLHQLSHVDADEEDRHAAPENFQMTDSFMNRHHPLHHHAPDDHAQGQPAVDRMTLDELHIGWSEGVEHHNGRNVPEGELIMEPEIPVYGDVKDEVHPTVAIEAGYIVEAGHD